MRDKVLERRIEELEGLVDLWNEFHRMIAAVRKGAEFGDEHNRKFLELKSSTARRFQAIADKFERRTLPEEEITDVLAQAVSLEQVKNMSSFTSDQIENTWHRVYIILNKFLGHLESQREALARVSSLGYGIQRLITNKLFILLVIVGIISGGVFLTYRVIMPALAPPPVEEGEESVSPAQPGTFYEKMTEVVSVVKEKVVKKESGEEGVEYAVNPWVFLIWGLGIIVCGGLASSKGKNPILWGFLGALCSPIVFIVLLLTR